jgi:hypothetical protein
MGSPKFFHILPSDPPPQKGKPVLGGLEATQQIDENRSVENLVGYHEYRGEASRSFSTYSAPL